MSHGQDSWELTDNPLPSWPCRDSFHSSVAGKYSSHLLPGGYNLWLTLYMYWREAAAWRLCPGSQGGDEISVESVKLAVCKASVQNKNNG